MTNRFGVGARLFHWTVVLLLLVQIPAGIAMIAPALEQGSIDRLFVLHKGLGVVLLVVVTARVLWRLTHPAPPMSEAIPELERRIAIATHGVIYAVLVVIAGSGYVHVVGGGFPIEMMDALGLPTMLPLMPEVASWASLVHRFSTFLLVALVAVHVAEVVRHHLVVQDGTLARMWPPLGGGSAGPTPKRNRGEAPVGWRRAERWLGLVRSLIMYWRPGRQRGLRKLYGPFVGAGDLVFDVGAHLGDRTAAFRRLGARVVALEPQPAVRRWLVLLVGRSRDVSVRAEAVGRTVGTARLALSHRTPSVSSLAEDWPNTLPERNPGFRGVRWDESVEVPVTTLDALIEQYGLPRFCKIDVEGYEAEVLAGLRHPIPALSVEFVAGALDVAEACVRRLEALGDYEFNAIEGEERRFMSKRWLAAEEMVAWLRDGGGSVSSGDVYARLRGEADAAGDGESDRGAEGSNDG